MKQENTKVKETWHYLRQCEDCNWRWYGLHCPHDGYQNPCPNCRRKPTPIEVEGCDCKFVDKYKEGLND